MKELKGKVALITGGTKGIGWGIAEALLKQGMNVVITGRSKEQVDEVATQLNENAEDGTRALGVVADVRDYEQMVNLTQQIMQEFEQLDVVIANAGFGYFAPIDEMPIEKWREQIDTNLTGAFYTIRATVEELLKSKGYYITISSLAGENFFEKGSAYNASKFGLTGFTQAVMLDLRKRGVKVTTIMPGSVTSHFNNHTPNESDAWKIQPEDIGQMVVDLLKMDERVLPSKIEVRPSCPPSK